MSAWRIDHDRYNLVGLSRPGKKFWPTVEKGNDDRTYTISRAVAREGLDTTAWHVDLGHHARGLPLTSF